MATDYKALGKRISNARKQAGITQEALGEQLNMTRKHISVIESAICLLTDKSISLPVRLVLIMTATDFSEFLQKMQGPQSRIILIGQ